MSDKRVTWLREQVTARLEKAKAACHDSNGHWFRRAPDVGPLYEGEVPESDEDGDWLWYPETVVYDEGRPSDEQFAHIAANDPRQVIADCEMHLGILDEHQPIGGDENECARCVTWDEDEEGDLCASPHPWPCRTVRLLASAYRHQPWYAEHWGWGTVTTEAVRAQREAGPPE